MKKTIGQAAYEKWMSLQTLPPMFPWGALPESGKAGWEEIATAAVEQYGLNQRTDRNGRD